jgi:hypothetical protein
MFLSYGEKLILSGRTETKRIGSIALKNIIYQQFGGQNTLTTYQKAKQNYHVYLLMCRNWA